MGFWIAGVASAVLVALFLRAVGKAYLRASFERPPHASYTFAAKFERVLRVLVGNPFR